MAGFFLQNIIEMKPLKKCLVLIFSIVIVGCTDSHIEKKQDAKEYVPVSKELFTEIAHMDSVMFDAFNAHDIVKLMSTFDTTLEFYHDQGGVTNYEQNKINFLKSFERNKTTGLRREIVSGSMEVYPIKDYGAVETGIHRFYATEKGQQEKLSSEAKFVQIWQKKAGAWKITRIISYGHQEYLK